jgi:hypothetical protein
MQAYSVPSWNTFKNFISSRNLSIQWLDLGDNYWLKGFDGPFELEYMMPKGGGSEQTDFENNFKNTGNQPLEFRSVDGLPMMASAMFTDSLNFWVDGSNGYLQILAGQTAYSVTNFSVPYKLNGVDIQWANANAGDFVNFDVGVYSGSDPTNQSTFIQIAQFANQYRLYGSAEKSFILNTVSTVPSTYNGLNVYIRTTYVNTGTNNAMLFINLLGYK